MFISKKCHLFSQRERPKWIYEKRLLNNLLLNFWRKNLIPINIRPIFYSYSHREQTKIFQK